MLLTSSVLSATSKQCFEQPAASFLVCSLIFIEYEKRLESRNSSLFLIREATGNRLILFENQIQTTSASPCRTQVQPAASFLVCSLIFIEYK